MEPKTQNAVIKSATITHDDHGCLSVWLHLDYWGAKQKFGGYTLYTPKSVSHHEANARAGRFIYRCMEIAGAADLKELAGKAIRVRADSNKVYAIGHIVKNDWFDPEADFSDQE